jgi:hypothetical protein
MTIPFSLLGLVQIICSRHDLKGAYSGGCTSPRGGSGRDLPTRGASHAWLPIAIAATTEVELLGARVSFSLGYGLELMSCGSWNSRGTTSRTG